jgi:hypothetical protein
MDGSNNNATNVPISSNRNIATTAGTSSQTTVQIIQLPNNSPSFS